MLSSEAFVTTEDGVRLFVRSVGSGSRPVIIPSASFLSDAFRRLAAADRTLVFYDLRNRGRSDHVDDSSKLARGIQHDVDDLEAVRAHVGVSGVDLIGHSYMGLMVALHAMKYPAHVRRVVQIAPAAPYHGRKYPAHLTGADETLMDISAKLAQLQANRQFEDPQALGQKMWGLMRMLYVADPADADKVFWPTDLPNESAANVMKHWSENIAPSIERLNLTAEDLAGVKVPVLIIHGVKDRHAPYGGAREWAIGLPDARLVTIDDAAHMPWIEAPDAVFNSIATFLGGAWPEAALRIT
jgi:proline iminopeptidase